MNKITITVEGKSGTGKSTVLQQIVGQLQAAGFPVTVGNFDHGPRATADHLVAMNSIREAGVEIVVNEKQSPRGES